MSDPIAKTLSIAALRGLLLGLLMGFSGAAAAASRTPEKPPSAVEEKVPMPKPSESIHRRVKFDFEIEFSNGGGIQGQDFRLDLEGDDISDAALADYIVKDMRLLMVDTVRILRKQVIVEKHKRVKSPDGAVAAALVDLSHTIEDGMVTYKGMPSPRIEDFLTRVDSRKSYAPGTEFHIASISMVANTGTYLDTPFHRFEGAGDLADHELARSADLEAVVVRAVGARAVTADHFSGIDVRGKAVLVETDWDRHWRTDAYFVDSPYLTADAARHLIDHGAVLVGIDSLNIDDTRDKTRPVHSMLLKAEIPIVEHLCNLESLPDTRLRFYAVPVKVRGMGTFPVRAFAIVGP